MYVRSLAAGFALLVVGVLACSGDAENEGGTRGDSDPCLKVRYSASDAGAARTSECMQLPAACKVADDVCSSTGDDCDQALEALCEDGTTRFSCVASSLNHRVVSVDLGCERR